MNMKYIVVANSVVAKVYAYHFVKLNHHHKLTLIAELNHPESSMRDQDLISDRSGNYQTNHSIRGSCGEYSAKEIEHDRFAHEVTSFLEEERNLNKFQSLTVIAAPHFFGLLEKHFSKPLKNLTDRVIQKNYIDVPEQELESIIRTH